MNSAPSLPLHPEDLFTLVCRPALPSDTPDVMELTRTIWEGEDYIPYVWKEWLADPEGLLAVAEYGGRVLGLGKLTKLSPSEWWLEGLRVDPQHQRQGIASHLHDYLLDHWHRHYGGALRLATSSTRIPVHRICERTGFEILGEYSFYAAEILQGQDSHFTHVALADVPQALDFVLLSPTLPFAHGLMDLLWRWASPSTEHLAEAVSREGAWWWRGREGLLVIGEDMEDEDKTPRILLLACPVEAIAGCLRDYRILAGSLGYRAAKWTAPLHPLLQTGLLEAGFQREWDDSLYIYEKKHPANS